MCLRKSQTSMVRPTGTSKQQNYRSDQDSIQSKGEIGYRCATACHFLFEIASHALEKNTSNNLYYLPMKKQSITKATPRDGIGPRLDNPILDSVAVGCGLTRTVQSSIQHQFLPQCGGCPCDRPSASFGMSTLYAPKCTTPSLRIIKVMQDNLHPRLDS